MSEVLSKSDLEAIKNYNEEFDRLKNITSKYPTQIKDSTIAQKAYNNTLINSSDTVKTLQKNTNGGKIAIDGLTKSSKAAELGMKGLAMAGNALASIGISVAIALVTKVVTSAINSEKEISEAINNASEKLNEQTSSLDSNMQKLSELRDELDNGNLSYEDAATKRSELIDIQSSLIKTYGEEAEGIDLVNGSLEDQLGLLDEIKKQKIRDAVNAGNKRGWWGNFINGVGNVANLLVTGQSKIFSKTGWKWNSDYLRTYSYFCSISFSSLIITYTTLSVCSFTSHIINFLSCVM